MRTFGQDMRTLEERRKRGQQVGMERAALALLLDCVDEDPKAPHNFGTLRASGSTFVNDLHKMSHEASVEEGGNTPTPLTTLTTPERRATELYGTVTFNQPYAANLHEGLRYDRKTKSLVPIKEWGMTRHYERDLEPAEATGPGFMSKKLERFGKRYFRVIARSVDRAVKGGSA